MNILLGETWHSSEYRRTELDLTAKVVSLVIFGVVLLWVSFELTLLLTVLFLVPLLVVGFVASLLTRRYGRSIVAQENEIYDQTLASLSGRFEIKAYNLERRFEQIFNRLSTKLKTTTVKADVAGSIVPQLLQVFLLPALILALLFGSDMGVPLERVALFVILVFRTMPHAAGIVGSFGQLGRHRGGHEVVRSHVERADLAQTSTDIDLRSVSIETVESIDLVAVDFSYPDAETFTLSNISATLCQGETYEISGPSGTGKSTLLAILLRLYQPSAGSLLINKQRVDLVDVHSFRQQIGYAGQRGTLFEGTASSNIVLDRSVPDDRLRIVESRLGLTEVFGRLPKGNLTELGRNGVEISGGERQRLQIARAILTNPSVLILDEATSELDAQSEASVLTAVEELCPDAIKVFVSHHSHRARSLGHPERPDSVSIHKIDSFGHSAHRPALSSEQQA